MKNEQKISSLVSNSFWLIVCLLFFTTSCKHKGSEADTESFIKTKTPVTITNISCEPLTETIELNAVSSFIKKSPVRATISGTLKNVEIDLGDYIEKGKLLFTIETKEASVLSHENLSNDSSLNFKGLIKINSSKAGVVSSITHHKGDYVQEGDELAVISDVESLVFLLQVPYELIGYIKTNQECEIILTDKRVIKGVISSNLPAMDMQSQTENFIIKPYKTEKLPENLMAKVSIVKSFKKQAFTLPKEAILANEEQTNFWVMKLINDSVAVKIPVKKGIETSGKIEILEPKFEMNDKIILTGNYGLPDTARVMIKK